MTPPREPCTTLAKWKITVNAFVSDAIQIFLRVRIIHAPDIYKTFRRNAPSESKQHNSKQYAKDFG